MQTFLPYPSIIKSLRCLDNKRLGKQRVETLQILRALRGITRGWQEPLDLPYIWPKETPLA